MSEESGRTCAYQYEPPTTIDSPEDITLPERTTTACPHPAVSGEDDRCLFHSEEREFPPDAIADEFLTVIEAPDRTPVFAGGRIGDLDLSGEVLKTADGSPIDLRGAIIDGTLDLSETTVEVPILLGEAAIRDELRAEGATFEAALDLQGTNIGSGLYIHDAVFESGVAAKQLDVNFVDARSIDAHGPAVFDRATFNVNVQFARSEFQHGVSFADAQFNRLIDCTGVEADGDVSFAGATIDLEATFTAGTVHGDISMRDATIGETLDFSHGAVHGDIDARDATVEGEFIARDLRVGGTKVACDGMSVTQQVGFSYMSAPEASVSIDGGSFGGEVWFTHASIGGPVSLSHGQFEGTTHLRDAAFGDDLSLRAASFESQSYLAGSTVEGNLDGRAAEFDHFQFSATVRGDIDFTNARFNSRGLFSNSEVGGRATFDDASFAGNPDFSDSRFKGPVSFDGTEFLVEPTFENTRFAVDPDLSAASFPQATSEDLADYRRDIIVAHPEDLQHSGQTVPLSAVSEDPVIPASAYDLVHPSESIARRVTQSLAALDGAGWYDLFERPVELSRTAASELSNADTGAFVYGVTVDTGADKPEAFITSVTLVGAYEFDEDAEEFVFSYLDPDLDEVDYLIAIPGSDSAFESGVSVGVRAEFRTAIFRRQVFQTALLEQQDDEDRVPSGVLPVLVAVGTQ